MKVLALSAGILAGVCSSPAGPSALEDISVHFSTNAEIVWQAPTGHLPKVIWIYKITPRIFSETTISNAIVLASFQDKGFPKPSTNLVILWAYGSVDGWRPANFAILPAEGQISYEPGYRVSDSPKDVLTNEAAVNHAWDCLLQLGVDRSEFVKTNAADLGLWGVFLPRQIDGIRDHYGSQGFQFQQFGSNGTIRGFSLLWPKLKRAESSPLASPQQIITCIRGHRVIVLPEGIEGRHYFARLKHLGKARKLTITKITPYYGEGAWGEEPPNGEPPKVVWPCAELEAVADFGNSNVTVRLVSPILSSDINRLLKE